MTQPVEVAACIVTYRCDLTRLRETVSSFHAQSVSTALTIVDNDSGADYWRELQALPQVKCISSGANRGFGFGHNIGHAQAPPHRYYLVLNPDVVLHENCLSEMVAYMDAHPEVGMLAPRVFFPDGSPQYLNKRLPSVFDLFLRRFLPPLIKNQQWCKARLARYEMRDVGYEAPCEVPFISGCCMMLRAGLWENIGGFDENFFMYLEDCDLTRRVSRHARAMYCPDAHITHHWERGSHKTFRLFVVMLRSMWHYFTKWGWKWV